MIFKEHTDEFLKSVANRAMQGNTPKTLRKASIELIGKQVQWLCILDISATEEDIEQCSIAGGEIISDFTCEYGLNEMIEKTKPNEESRELKNVVYKRVDRHFEERDIDDQEWFSQNNYCEKCKKADTGLNNIIEYEFDGKIYVDGICNICSNPTSSEVITETE